MRFVWLRREQESRQPSTAGISKLLLVSYNVVWWLPVALPILGLVSYRTASLLFLFITLVRAVINGYRVNVLPVDKAMRFALRSP